MAIGKRTEQDGLVEKRENYGGEYAQNPADLVRGVILWTRACGSRLAGRLYIE